MLCIAWFFFTYCFVVAHIECLRERERKKSISSWLWPNAPLALILYSVHFFFVFYTHFFCLPMIRFSCFWPWSWYTTRTSNTERNTNTLKKMHTQNVRKRILCEYVSNLVFRKLICIPFLRCVHRSVVTSSTEKLSSRLHKFIHRDKSHPVFLSITIFWLQVKGKK